MINTEHVSATRTSDIFKFVGYSVIGIFMFFITITINGKTTIPIDHVVTALKGLSGGGGGIYGLIVIILGGVYPFYKKTWNKDKVTLVFSILKLLGIVIGFMAFFNFGPSFLFEKDMIPFLFNSLAIPVGIIVPVGSVFLAFLVGYGLMEFIGVIMKPVMRPLWKTPGRSAVDAVASFVGSYSIALLITNRVYKEGKYTTKEAAIIATGFSTVSATFMIIVAKTLGIMNLWTKYFWVTLVVTFIVTAITARLRPLSKKSDEYYNNQKGDPEIPRQGNMLKNAWEEGIKASKSSVSIGKNIVDNLKDGFVMAMGILPSIMSVGLIGLILAKYTPVFNIIGYVFYPIALLFKLPEPLLASKACAVGIAEMFLPALLVVGAPLVTKFVVAVVSISAILFFSASIPCILSTDIPISIPEIIVIWFERTVLTLMITIPIAYLIL
ncbi:YjiH family protein [Clostridium estertheticum]|uniref:YjiH family protein n=1 Tax=Clostridium estertheticum TaxID=238834 RepID=UPI0013E94BD3|nr:YjiH family protein [Clostridium estertheticum]MBZ9685255.1 YjiH family protein [Clostridium estertheticum]